MKPNLLPAVSATATTCPSRRPVAPDPVVPRRAASIFALATLILSSALAPALAGPAPVENYKQLKYPALPRINVPEPKRVELANGLVVYLLEDHELPLISLSVLVRAGSRWEPIEKAGLAAITGAVIRTGGSAAHPGDQLDDELDRLAAQVETSIGEDSGSATVSVLKEDIDKGLSILSDLLQRPAFPEDKIELAKIAQRDAIASRNDDPGTIADREFKRVLLGPNSAYGHQPEIQTIDAIRRDDLVAFHQRYFQPENLIVGAWGDFNAEEMRARLEKAFGPWPRGAHPKPAAPAVEPSAASRAGLYFIPKDDVNQSVVEMGRLAGQRSDPDYYALSLMNRVLGGGFSSRLFSQVRSVQGLAYSVESHLSAGWDRAGELIASGGTKSATTIKIVQAMKQQIAKLAETGVTADELASAKDAVLKGFAFEFDSTGKIVQRLMTYDYYGYPRDYLQRYQENIEKVTPADVLHAARRYLRTDQFVILVLGHEKDFEQPLSTLGAATKLDLTIPKGAKP